MGTFFTDLTTSDNVIAATLNNVLDELDAALANLLDSSSNLRGLVNLTNQSGGALAAGDVVVVDTSNDSSCTTTTTEGDTEVVGVVVTGGADGASVEVCEIGITTVTVDGATTRGQYLKTSSTAKKATPTSTMDEGVFAMALTAHSSSVTALLFATSGSVCPATCQGRLTLTSNTPVTTADVTAATTVYYTPYIGDKIALYDGSKWVTYTFSEVSVAVPSTTNTPFDIFIYDNAGTLTLQALDWTNDTTRATALTRQDEIYVKTGATGYRYLGTGRTTGVSGQCEDSMGRRLLWNYYNRTIRAMEILDTTTHTYVTGTYRCWNNDTSVRVDFVVGVAEDLIHPILGFAGNSTAGEATVYVGIGYDTITASTSELVSLNPTMNIRFIFCQDVLAPAEGFHYLQAIEYGGNPSPDFYRVHIVVGGHRG